MNPLDGNAIAGALASFYGTDMTAAEGTCRNCGLPGLIAELPVYVAGPGSVARCPACSGVLLVVTEIREEVRVHADGFALAAGS
jgi:hypothetical protein